MKNEYGKIINGEQSVTCTIYNFPKHVSLKFTDEECPEGYYPIHKAENKPTPRNGEILWFKYTLVDGVLNKEYFCRKPPRVFSKYKIYMELQPLGLYETFEGIMKENTLPNGINVFKAYEISNELSEEDPIFFQLISPMIEQLGISEEEGDAILEKCKA